MIPERNSFCPCKSGKRYKKCCGQTAVKPYSDLIELNRSVAYSGDVGRRRKAFYEEYSRFKTGEMARLVAELKKDIESKGEAISCARGCTHCCLVYVFTTLQEADAIVYYLYENETVLTHFITSYEEWRRRIIPIERNLERLEILQEKVLTGRETNREVQVFHADLTIYAKLRNPCPFLIDSACSIYQLRPYTCACVVSSSPPDWCDRDNPHRQKPSIYKTQANRATDMPYLGLAPGIIFGCLPELVHNILVYGYSFLSSFKGLETLKFLAADDPEIKNVLREIGAL